MTSSRAGMSLHPGSASCAGALFASLACAPARYRCRSLAAIGSSWRSKCQLCRFPSRFTKRAYLLGNSAADLRIVDRVNARVGDFRRLVKLHEHSGENEKGGSTELDNSPLSMLVTNDLNLNTL